MIHVPDTNVLLRFANRADAQHAVVLSAVGKLKADGDEIYIIPQNLRRILERLHTPDGA